MSFDISIPRGTTVLQAAGILAGGPGSGRHASFGTWKKVERQDRGNSGNQFTDHYKGGKDGRDSLRVTKLSDTNATVTHAPAGGKYADESPMPDTKQFNSHDDAKNYVKERFGINASASDGVGYTPKARPTIAVKTPSFKAPKVIGKKPAMITGSKVKAAVMPTASVPAVEGPSNIQSKKKIKAGGPGSGRKPEGRHPDSQGKMDKLHKQLINKGYTYKPSLSVANQADTLTRHVYQRYNIDTGKIELMHINERKNGYHNIT